MSDIYLAAVRHKLHKDNSPWTKDVQLASIVVTDGVGGDTEITLSWWLSRSQTERKNVSTGTVGPSWGKSSDSTDLSQLGQLWWIPA
jgi:hypothetical protein